MKRIQYILAFVALLGLVACNPTKGIYEELDKEEKHVTKTKSIALSDEQFKGIIDGYISSMVAKFEGDAEAKKAYKAELERKFRDEKNFSAFSDNFSAAEHLTPFAAKQNPEWGKDSRLSVEHKQLLPASENVKAIGKAAFVELKKEDFEALGLNSITNLKKKDLDKVIEAAKAKATDNPRSLLIRGSFDAQNMTWFVINGSIADSKKYHAITMDEYKSMGARYGNFSASMPAENYIPALLGLTYPYAQPGDSKVVVWLFYKDKKTFVHYGDYTFNGTKWIVTERTIPATSQFIHNGKAWVYDPTIKFTFEKTDFVTLFNWVKANKPNYISKKYPTNEEFWFGGSSYYNNFNLDGGETVGDRPEEQGLDATALLKAKYERLKEAIKLVLANKYPDTPAVTNGIEQFYVVKVNIRVNRQNTDYNYRFKGLGNGKFEYVEGPLEI
ncbi:MAG: hypothetical protein Q3998_01745 [Porphyromonas sp.]|nr:hypothetical protein [Porphyromonas sp.]